MITILFVIGVFSASIVYLDYTKADYEHERDAYHIALEINKITSVINANYPEVSYVHNKIDHMPHFLYMTTTKDLLILKFHF